MMGVGVMIMILFLDSPINFFKNYFNNNSSQYSITNSIMIPTLVGVDDNDILSKLIDEKEIWEVIKSMNINFVVGDDGFTTTFLILLKIIYIMLFLIFFQGISMLRYFTSTTIILIPKKDNLDSWMTFCNISLCTFLTKYFQNFVQKGLYFTFKIISHNQMGFVKDITISDNILLV